MKYKLMLLLILLFSLSFVSSARYMIGYVGDADDGTLAENYTMLIWGNNGINDNATTTIGIYGSSNADNTYLLDVDLVSFGEPYYAQAIDEENNNASDIVTLTDSGTAGYFIMPSTQIYNTEIGSITIFNPLNNSYNNTGFFRIKSILDSRDSCRYTIGGNNNVTMINEQIRGILDKGNFSYGDFSYIDSNSTYIWGLKNINITKLFMNGTETGEEFQTDPLNDAPRGLCFNGTYLYTADNTDNLIYEYYQNGTYTGNNISLISGNNDPTGLTCNSTHIKVLDRIQDKIYVYNISSRIGGVFVDLPSQNGEPNDIYEDTQYIYISDATDGRIYEYYNNGTYRNNYYQSIVADTNGLAGNSTNLFISDLSTKSIGIASKFKDSPFYNATNNSLAEGNYNITFNCNDSSNNFIFSNTHFFTIDKTNPVIVIDNITTQSNSQTFSVNSSVYDLNSGSCKYSIYTLSGSIDGSNNNISFTCNNTVSPTTTSYGNFTLRLYATDLAGNENYTEQNFTLVGFVGGGGGGGATTGVSSSGTTEVIIVVNNESIWKMSSGGVGQKYEILINKGTSRNFPLYFTSYIGDNRTIQLKCEDIEGDACQYLNFTNQEFELLPLRDTEQVQVFELKLPENASIQDSSFNIIALDDSGNSGSITAFVNEQGGFFLLLSKIFARTQGGFPISIIFFGTLIISGLIIARLTKEMPLRPLITILGTVIISLVVLVLI